MHLYTWKTTKLKTFFIKVCDSPILRFLGGSTENAKVFPVKSYLHYFSLRPSDHAPLPPLLVSVSFLFSEPATGDVIML